MNEVEKKPGTWKIGRLQGNRVQKIADTIRIQSKPKRIMKQQKAPATRMKLTITKSSLSSIFTCHPNWQVHMVA